MPRYFTRDGAQALLGRLEPMIHDGIALKAEYASAEGELRDISRRVFMAGGSQIDQEAVLAIRQTRDTAAARLKQLIDAIQETGCLVKDLDIGLLDFPTLYDGRVVYLCWRAGEPRIAWWHGPEEGFAGRRPIDAAFLMGHGDGISGAPQV